MSQLGLGMVSNDREPGNQNRGRGILAVLVAVVVVVGLLVGVVAFAADLLGQSGPADYPGPGTGGVTVEIANGASLSEIGAVLAAADVVASEEAFIEAAGANENSAQIQPGTYVLALQMSGAEAVVALLDPASRARGR